MAPSARKFRYKDSSKRPGNQGQSTLIRSTSRNEEEAFYDAIHNNQIARRKRRDEAAKPKPVTLARFSWDK